MSVGCVEPGIWRLFQNAAGEYPQNSVRAREIRRNNRVRLTLAARRLLLVMAKNSVYASYTSEPQSVFNGFPACSPSVTDFDGDGFGFENNQSCSISTGTQDQAAVTPNTATSSESPSVFSSFPACSPSVTDFDGDGFGFENNQSCVIGTSTQTTSQSEPQSGISGFPVCSASIIDFDGDGFAFENNQSCVIP